MRANNGDVEAEAELAREFANKGDYNSSLQWNLRAASHGSSSAMLALWSIYSNGRGVPANQNEANKWLVKAADAGCGAHSNLYLCAMNQVMKDFQKILSRLFTTLKNCQW